MNEKEQRQYMQLFQEFPLYDNRVASSYRTIEIMVHPSEHKEHIMNHGTQSEAMIGFFLNVALETMKKVDTEEEKSKIIKRNMEEAMEGGLQFSEEARLEYISLIIKKIEWFLDYISENNGGSSVECFDYGKKIMGISLYESSKNHESRLDPVSEIPFAWSIHDLNRKDVFMSELENHRKGMVYHVTADTLLHFCLLNIEVICKSGLKIQKCTLCGRYFVPNEINQKYCKFGNLEYNGKACSLVAKDIKQRQNLEKQPLQKLDKKIYDRLQKRKEYSIADNGAAELFFEYIDARESKKNAVKNGEISEQEYAEFLNSWEIRTKLKKRIEGKEVKDK